MCAEELIVDLRCRGHSRGASVHTSAHSAISVDLTQDGNKRLTVRGQCCCRSGRRVEVQGSQGTRGAPIPIEPAHNAQITAFCKQCRLSQILHCTWIEVTLIGVLCHDGTAGGITAMNHRDPGESALCSLGTGNADESVTCPEALMWLLAIACYQARSYQTRSLLPNEKLLPKLLPNEKLDRSYICMRACCPFLNHLTCLSGKQTIQRSSLTTE